MPPWEKVKIESLCIRIVSGGTPSTSVIKYYGGNIPWLKTGEINFEYIRNTESFITEDGFNNSSAKWIKPNSVIVALYGNTSGKTAITKIKLTTNQACCNLEVDELKADYRFIYYTLYKNYEQLKSLANGGAQQNLNVGIIKNYEIDLPDLPTQSCIASILSAFDDKIELNRQMNKTLEEMAQFLYIKHIVNSIDQENLPKGWRWGKYGEFISSVSLTHKFPNDKIIFLNTSDILEGKVLTHNYSEVNSLPGQAKKSIRRNDILFSEIRPANKRFAFINFDSEDYVVSTKLMVLRSKSDIDSIFFYFLLTRGETLTLLQNIAESRSGTFPQITFDQIKEMELIIPENNILENFIKNILNPVYQIIFNNNKEIESLVSLRDMLLPKLLNGEIQVDSLPLIGSQNTIVA